MSSTLDHVAGPQGGALCANGALAEQAGALLPFLGLVETAQVGGTLAAPTALSVGGNFTFVNCKTCLTPTTRPNGRFSAEGICASFEFAVQSHNINHLSRFQELTDIVRRKTRTNRARRHNCIVGVSGGKDSTRKAFWARDQRGLNPLLVSVAFPPRHISQIGVNNLSNLITLALTP